MATYSFVDVQAAISGPGGAFSLGSGGVADEGITIEMVDDKSTMVTGADGTGQHNLHASKAGKVTIRLLKTSPLNAKLTVMYNRQTTSAAFHGQNVISVRDPVRGDDYGCRGCAFAKFPTNTYGKAGPVMEWTFNAIEVDPILGAGFVAA